MSKLTVRFCRCGWSLVAAGMFFLCASAETLTWDGGNAGAWDMTTENWKTEGGTATAWIEGSSIIVPNGQVVNATTVFTVAGATLGSGATIGAEGTFGGRGCVTGDLGVSAGGTLVLDGTLQVGGKVAIGADANVIVTGKPSCSCPTPARCCSSVDAQSAKSREKR